MDILEVYKGGVSPLNGKCREQREFATKGRIWREITNTGRFLREINKKGRD